MKNDSVYLHHIIDAIEKIERYSTAQKETFLNETHWQDAIIRNLEIIGEATKRIGKPLKSRHPDVPWRVIAGLSDVLIHITWASISRLCGMSRKMIYRHSRRRSGKFSMV